MPSSQKSRTSIHVSYLISNKCLKFIFLVLFIAATRSFAADTLNISLYHLTTSSLVLDSLLISGNSQLSTDEILSLLNLQPGDSIDSKLIEERIDNLISLYETKGFPFASVSIEDVRSSDDLQKDGISIAIVIKEGDFVKIASIEPVGNKETQSDVIVRESGVKIGEPYDESHVSKIRSRLNRLNIFSKIDDPELFIRVSDGVLKIPVEEGRTNTFDGILGFVPASGNNDGYFTGLINVAMLNLFGSARKISIHWQRDGGGVQEMAVRYTEPWAFDLPFDINLGFNQRQQDTSFVKRNYDVKLEIRQFDNVTLAGIFNVEKVIPSNSLTGNFLYASSSFSYGAELRYDTRDDNINPIEGVLFCTDYQIGRKTIDVPLLLQQQLQSSSTLQRVGVDFEFIQSIFTRQVISLSFHGKEISNDYIGLGDMYRLGGATTLRGYRENQFYGSRIGWSNTEYRLLLSRQSSAFIFFDYGYYSVPDNQLTGIPASQHFKYGYGIGIRMETGIGIIGVSFALGKGDTFTQGKIHFGLISVF